MVDCSEIARIIDEFDGVVPSADGLVHHEQKRGIQESFKNDVTCVIDTLAELGNLSEDKTGELMAIHSKDIMDDTVVKTVQNVTKVGQD